ncbi:hypothetical protein ONQ62_26795, partial [Salmonella enterica subsp. enterica serovar Virginia]|nr:hypothetical protein [Salmonella enterica subsp. enterica serovar Virginia]
EQDKKLFRNALEVEALTKGFDNGPLFKNVNLLLEVGEKLAVLTGYDLRHVFNDDMTRFDLTRILTGSEGTLAFITEARLDITPI